MDHKRYLYVQIYTEILNEIRQGVYKPTQQLPTEKELSSKYKVSRITSQKAMNRLVEEGIVERRPGMGSFVTDAPIPMITETEYKPVAHKKHRPIIGLIVEAIWSTYGVELFDGAYEQADKLGYDLVLKKSYGDQEKEKKAMNELLDMGAVGIIIMPVHRTYYSEEILRLTVEKYPIVFVDRKLEGIHIPFVGTNNEKAMMDAIDYLTSRGHQNIGLIAAKEHDANTLDERKNGYIKGLIENNLIIEKDNIYDHIDSLMPNNENEDMLLAMHQDISEFLIKNEKITVLVAVEYYIACIAKQALKSIGKQVPEDIEILCFDSPKSYVGNFEFTHIRQREHMMGKTSVELLHNVILDQPREQIILLEADIIKGRSTN